MAIYPQVTLEVLARGKGHSVARLAGNHMPVLILRPDAIADLRRLFEAATLRIRALPDSQPSDAIGEFVRTFEGFLSQHDTEAKAYGTVLSDRTDHDAVRREFELEMSALNQLGDPRETVMQSRNSAPNPAFESGPPSAAAR
jgi:hypothetical protein